MSDDAKKKLLIVEDDTFFCRWLETVLKHTDVEIQYASNGVEAIAHARRWSPDLILMDAVLPVMDGFAAFRTMRGDDQLKRIRVIFMSGEAQDGALGMARDLGAWATLKKPMPPKVVRRKVYEGLSVVGEGPVPQVPDPESPPDKQA